MKAEGFYIAAAVETQVYKLKKEQEKCRRHRIISQVL